MNRFEKNLPLISKILAFIFTIFFFNCNVFFNLDTQKNGKNREILGALLLSSSANATSSSQGTSQTTPQSQTSFRFGIVGDSWTNFGSAGVSDLRVQLANRGYQMTGTTTAGITLSTALSQNLHRRAIDSAGNTIKYIIVSLGGNDYQNNLTAYINASVNGGTAVTARIATIQSNLNTMINDGNSYKISRYGGGNLIWILHGYDYPNVTVPLCTIATPITSSYTTWGTSLGASVADVNYVATTGFNALNTMYQNVASASGGSVRYINLRGTLGGPPNSNSASMFDCIHPNTNGFNLIANAFVSVMTTFTGTDR